MGLRENVRVLKYYDGMLKSRTLDYQYFEILEAKIIPLIRLLFPSAVQQWHKEMKAHQKKYALTEKAAQGQVYLTFKKLKTILNNENLLTHYKLKDLINEIDEIFEFVEQKLPTSCKKTDCKICSKQNNCKFLNKHAYAIPSYYFIVFDKIEYLLNVIVEIGRTDLVVDFAMTHCYKTYKFVLSKDENGMDAYSCSECGYVYDSNVASKDSTGELIPFKKLSQDWTCPICNNNVNKFELYQYPTYEQVVKCKATFAPAIDELMHFNHMISPRNLPENTENLLWVAWNHLHAIEWGRTMSRDYLRKKDLKYINFKECQRSVKLLTIHSMICELKTNHKKRSDQHNILSYGRNNTEKCVDIVLKKLFDQTGNGQDKALIPHAFKLQLEETRDLLLEVEWTEELVEIFVLASFNENSEPFQALKLLIANPGKLVPIAPIKSRGENSNKILKRIGFCKTLEEIFIFEKTSFKAALRSDRVVLSDIPKLNLKKLFSMISRLKNAGYHHRFKLQKVKESMMPHHCWYLKNNVNSTQD